MLRVVLIVVGIYVVAVQPQKCGKESLPQISNAGILSHYWFEIGSCLRISLVLHSQFPDTPLMASDYVIDTEDFRGDLPQGTSPMLFNRYAQNGR